MKAILLFIVLVAFSCFGGAKTDSLKARDSVIVVKDTVEILKGIKFSATDTALKLYKQGTFPCTLKTSTVTEQQIGTAKYTMVGNIVFISLPNLSGTSNSITLSVHCAIPSAIRPTYARDGWCTVTDNGAIADGNWLINITAGIPYIVLNKSGGSFTSSGTKGIGDASLVGSEVTLQYIKN